MVLGRTAMSRAMPEALSRLESRLPAVLMASLREQWERLADMDKEIARIERRLKAWLEENCHCRSNTPSMRKLRALPHFM